MNWPVPASKAQPARKTTPEELEAMKKSPFGTPPPKGGTNGSDTRKRVKDACSYITLIVQSLQENPSPEKVKDACTKLSAVYDALNKIAQGK